jgi:hypothetical protein
MVAHGRSNDETGGFMGSDPIEEFQFRALAISTLIKFD